MCWSCTQMFPKTVTNVPNEGDYVLVMYANVSKQILILPIHILVHSSKISQAKSNQIVSVVMC